MPLNIKDRATEQSVRELAGLTGESVTTAVCRAAEERLQRVRREGAAGSLTAELLEIGDPRLWQTRSAILMVIGTSALVAVPLKERVTLNESPRRSTPAHHGCCPRRACMKRPS
jgi:hypothetical protein